MVENFGIKLDILDVGWGAIAAVTWSSPIIAILIFCILATNIIMLALKATDTLDVDIWNYHHMAIVGIMVYFVTKNVALGIAATVVMAIVTFKMSDWTAPLVEEYFGIPGVSLPTMSALSSIVIAAPLNWILDRIPGINKIDFEIKDAQKYLGFFGEPTMMGLILGCIIGVLAKYNLASILSLGVNMAAVLPGNRVLPFADLAVVTFRVALVVAVTRGNLFKNIIMGLVCTGAILLAGTATAPVLTELALSVGLDLGEGLITSFAATSLTVSFLVYKAFISNLYISVPLLVLVVGGTWMVMSRINKKKAEMAAQGEQA